MSQQAESGDPVKFIYNITPNSKIMLGRSSIPAAFHYTPFQKTDLPFLEYAPLTCTCQAVLNPYCEINYNLKTITCCICGTLTALPANYAQHIQPNKLPYEFMSQNTTIEFKSGAKITNYRYSYLFVIDLNIQQKQLTSIKQLIASVINNLPNKYNVGLVTYGRNVHIHQFSTKISTNYCINGIKEYNTAAIMNLIGIMIKNDVASQSSDIVKRFIVPVSQYRKSLMNRIKNLRVQNHVYVNQRKHSCFGQAINITISMAEVSTISTRIVYLVGNPSTVGPGMTINTNFKTQMRSPKQLSKGQNIEYFASAKKYYDSFLKRVINKNIIMDIFIFTCNQIGFTEMSDLFLNSGGFVVMHEQFRDRIFRESFPKIFPIDEEGQDQKNNRIRCVTEGTVYVYCSKEIALNGALGQCYSLNKSKSYVSDKVIGKGGTHAWYLGSFDNFKTLTFIYQTKQSEAKSNCYYIQIKAVYKNQNGQFVTRVTTVKKQWSNLNHKIIEGFDEEAAVVFLAKQCVNKMLYEEQLNIRQWLDQILVKWAQAYANYIKNDESSFSLPSQMKRLPQMIYHLRRSHFVNRFGISLDQSFYKGFYMSRQNVSNCLTMIQPILLSYSLNNQSTEPIPVALDEEQMNDQCILLLDTYFVVAEWYGTTIKSWFDNQYHQQEGYENVAQLFNSPKIDIDDIMQSRFPVSNFYHIYPYHSKERYLKSRVNPKQKSLGTQHENMLTDDSDLKGFTQHLMKVVTKQN